MATSLRYDRERDPEVLASWSIGLLQTLRLRASAQFAEALGEVAKLDRSRRGVGLSGFVASLRR